MQHFHCSSLFPLAKKNPKTTGLWKGDMGDIILALSSMPGSGFPAGAAFSRFEIVPGQQTRAIKSPSQCSSAFSFWDQVRHRLWVCKPGFLTESSTWQPLSSQRSRYRQWQQVQFEGAFDRSSLFLGVLVGRAPQVWHAEVMHSGMHVWQQITAVQDNGSERAVTVH